MISIIKYFKGYVRIKLWGATPERFFNLCSNRGILLWKIEKVGDIYHLNISLSAFRKLRSICRKTKTRVVILKRYGLPFLLPKMNKRKFFILGLFIAVCFWFLSSLHIWDIEFIGNRMITGDVLLHYLNDHSIHIGCPKNKVDIALLEQNIRKDFKEIIWVSVKLNGTNLEVYLKENDKLISEEHNDIISDLYANETGIIRSILIKSGISMVKVGDSVEKGTLLVSGTIPIFNEDTTIRNNQYTRSVADIEIECEKEIYIEVSKYYMEKKFTGRESKRFRFTILGKSINLGKDATFPYYDELGIKKDFFIMNKIKFPFFLYTYYANEYQKTECKYSEEECENILNDKYNELIKKMMQQNIIILNEDVVIQDEGSYYCIKGTITMIKKTGTEIVR